MRSLRRLILPAAALVAVVAGYLAAYVLRDNTPVNQEVAVEFRLPDLDGQIHQGAEWRGRTILVNFWATWCPPCREEIPLFMSARERFGGRGFEVVGIAVDQADAVLAYSDSMGITYPLLIGDDQVFALMSKLGNATGALPYSVIVSPAGKVLASKRGRYTETELNQAIEATLPSSKSL